MCVAALMLSNCWD